MANDFFEDFRCAVDCTEERVDLARAALAIARGDYPDLDIGSYLSRIDQIAISVNDRLGSETDPCRSIASLNYVLFREQGFRRNRDDYFDPKNSFLNEVLERKKGIPISLSVLYVEIAQRIGLRLRGVNLPGHFLVKYIDDDQEIMIDPFNGGEIQSLASLEQLLRHLYGKKVALRPDLLVSATKKQILRRMLNNLKIIYLRANDLLKGLSIIERLLILEPGSADALRDRGMVYLKLECFRQALNDFEAYLRLVPDADDAVAVKHQIVNLRKQVTRIH
jgi:regulator of sirC expression with transglutaminase-like and TPR domain